MKLHFHDLLGLTFLTFPTCFPFLRCGKRRRLYLKLTDVNIDSLNVIKNVGSVDDVPLRIIENLEAINHAVKYSYADKMVCNLF